MKYVSEVGQISCALTVASRDPEDPLGANLAPPRLTLVLQMTVEKVRDVGDRICDKYTPVRSNISITGLATGGRRMIVGCTEGSMKHPVSCSPP